MGRGANKQSTRDHEWRREARQGGASTSVVVAASTTPRAPRRDARTPGLPSTKAPGHRHNKYGAQVEVCVIRSKSLLGQSERFPFNVMAPARHTVERCSDLIDLLDYINFLKKKTLIVGYLSLVGASVGFCIMTACAAVEMEHGDESETAVLMTDGGSMWPKWSRIERGVVLAAVAIIDAGQAMVSALLVIAAHREWGVLVTPWLLHSALWLPAQGAALMAAAPAGHSTPFALVALICFASGLVLWLRACSAVRDFQRLVGARGGGGAFRRQGP